MYVIDYNTKLAQAKDNYYKTSRKMKRGYDKQLDENNKINKIKSDKQVKAHQNYVKDLNDANERHLQETTSRANNLMELVIDYVPRVCSALAGIAHQFCGGI